MPASSPLINGKTNWELKLEELKMECDKADRELWPNRFALRSEYNARRASFLSTQIEMERQKVDAESYAYAVRPSGLLVPVMRKPGPFAPEGTLEPPPVTRIHATRDAARSEARRALAHSGSVYRRPDLAEPMPYRYREPVKDDIGYETKGMDEQKFIQHVGMNSNCNVNLQSKSIVRHSMGDFGYSTSGRKSYRLFCDKCKATQQVEATVVERYDPNHPQIKDFCTNHRHDTTRMPDAEGRKFRA